MKAKNSFESMAELHNALVFGIAELFLPQLVFKATEKSSRVLNKDAIRKAAAFHNLLLRDNISLHFPPLHLCWLIGIQSCHLP